MQPVRAAGLAGPGEGLGRRPAGSSTPTSPGWSARRFPLGDEELEALQDQTTDSEISDLAAAGERVRAAVRASCSRSTPGSRRPTAQPLLFEAYFRYDGVVAAGQADVAAVRARRRSAALLVLQLVQIPFAWSMARRLQRQQRERHRLLQPRRRRLRRRAPPDRGRPARRRGAGPDRADVHAGRRPARATRRRPGRASWSARRPASCGRRTGDLRSLLVDIYPPSLAEEGLPASLAELACGLERAGMTVELDVDQTRRTCRPTTGGAAVPVGAGGAAQRRPRTAGPGTSSV